MRVSSKIAIVLAGVVAAASVGTVAATWSYTNSNTDSVDIAVEAEMGDNWNSLYRLLSDIVSAMNDSGSNLATNVEYRLEGHGIWNGGILQNIISWFIGDGEKDYYGSMDQTYDVVFHFLGTNTLSMAEEDIAVNYGSNYSYIVQSSTYNSQPVYYVYLCDTYLGETGTMTETTSWGQTTGYTNTTAGNPTVPIGENIYHIYRTRLIADGSTGNWVADSTYTLVDGYAPSCWYEEMREYSPIARQTPAYDVDAWKEDTRGSAQDTAIWTFDGDSTAVTADSTNTYVYYKMQTASVTYYYAYSSGTYAYYGTTYTNGASTHSYSYNTAGTYTITVSDPNATVNVYTVNGNNTTEVVPTSFGSGTYTFSLNTAATTYYIRLSGATDYTLTVSS